MYAYPIVKFFSRKEKYFFCLFNFLFSVKSSDILEQVNKLNFVHSIILIYPQRVLRQSCFEVVVKLNVIKYCQRHMIFLNQNHPIGYNRGMATKAYFNIAV